jgi:cystathionine gamma-synthase
MHAGGELGYMRDGNETLAALETTIGTLEGGSCTVFSSGMAAANALFELFTPGAVIVASQFSYTGIAVRLKELNDLGRIELRLVDVTDNDAIRAAVTNGKPADWIWVESPTNPMMEICDISETAAIGKSVGAKLAVDNTFMTPLRQRPLELGAHVVMHSVTKSLSGHSDLLMGALVTADSKLYEEIVERRVLLGAVPSAFDAFLVMRGIRTLAVRLDRAERNAIEIADRLSKHPNVSAVFYPGLSDAKNYQIGKAQTDGPGTVLSFVVDGDADAAELVCQSTQLITHATSLGGVETLMERRRRWPHENSGVPESLIRIAVGIENLEDIWTDLNQALSATGTLMPKVTPKSGV